MLGSDLEADVIRAEPLQAIRHDAHGQIGMVALAAEVAEIQMAQFSAHDLLGGIGGGFVGEMTVAAKDALFEAPGTMRTVLQHFDVVVRFENENVGRANTVKHVSRCVPKIGQKANVTRGRAQEKADRVLRVVGNVKTLDGDIADFEAFACAKQAAIEALGELVLKRFLSRAIAIDRNVESGAELDQPVNMVRMFVRDENASEIFGRASNRSKTLPDLAQAEPGINQDAGFIGFQVRAIAGRTAAENSQTNSHVRDCNGS